MSSVSHERSYKVITVRSTRRDRTLSCRHHDRRSLHRTVPNATPQPEHDSSCQTTPKAKESEATCRLQRTRSPRANQDRGYPLAPLMPMRSAERFALKGPHRVGRLLFGRLTYPSLPYGSSLMPAGGR
jgi:hypothetical protein